MRKMVDSFYRTRRLKVKEEVIEFFATRKEQFVSITEFCKTRGIVDIKRFVRSCLEVINTLNIVVVSPHELFLMKLTKKYDLSSMALERLFDFHDVLVNDLKLFDEITGRKDPHSYLSSLVYIAAKIAGDGVTQRDVAKDVNMTHITIRSRVDELLDLLIEHAEKKDKKYRGELIFLKQLYSRGPKTKGEVTVTAS